MPIYVYQEILPDGSDGETFEVMQKMSEDALTEHPETGNKVKRVISAPNLPLEYGDASLNDKLSNKNLERLGLTKYEKKGDGYYEKTAGDKGPGQLFAD